jgi:hypothetical protein
MRGNEQIRQDHQGNLAGAQSGAGKAGREMTAEVLPFTGITRLDTDPSRVLAGAQDANLTEVVVIGVDADGEEYFASSQADGAAVLWHLERAKWRLMRMHETMMEGEE